MKRDIHEIVKEELSHKLGINSFSIPNFFGQPINIGQPALTDIRRKSRLITEFLAIVSHIAYESVHCNSQTIINILFSESPVGMTVAYHKALPSCCWEIPMIFRTDESISGKIYEIQAPGSGWGDLSLYAKGYKELGYEIPDWILDFPSKYENCFIDNIDNKSPRIFHMLDAASVPHSMRYLMAITSNLRYWGLDKEVNMHDIDYVVSHSVVSIVTSNYFKDYLSLAREGKLKFAIQPNLIFDEKAIYLLPFYRETYKCFSDEIRNIFPFTSIIESGGFYNEEGAFENIGDFCKRKPGDRKYYLKYGGPDISRNWGSRSVYRLSGNDCEMLLNMANELAKKGEIWLLQKEVSKELAPNASDEIVNLFEKQKMYLKLSSFYGKGELMGIKVMGRKHFKVHGQKDTYVGLGI